MSYLEQEKYSEILVNKLCQRIKNSILDKEVVNSAYCLTLLNYNEKAVRKLLVQFEDYRDKLSNQVINEHFKNIILKVSFIFYYYRSKRFRKTLKLNYWQMNQKKKLKIILPLKSIKIIILKKKHNLKRLLKIK